MNSKTLTHLNAHFDKYHSTVALLVKDESYQSALLDTVAKFWKNSTFHAVLTVRILEKFKLVDAKNIVSWAFKNFEKEEDLHDNFSIHWEIFFSLLSRLSSDIDLYQQEILRVFFLLCEYLLTHHSKRLKLIKKKVMNLNKNLKLLKKNNKLSFLLSLKYNS